MMSGSFTIKPEHVFTDGLTPTTAISVIHHGVMLAQITQAGEVSIDFSKVEAAIADPEHAQPVVLAFARLIAAVQDGTYTAVTNGERDRG